MTMKTQPGPLGGNGRPSLEAAVRYVRCDGEMIQLFKLSFSVRN